MGRLAQVKRRSAHGVGHLFGSDGGVGMERCSKLKNAATDESRMILWSKSMHMILYVNSEYDMLSEGSGALVV